MWMQAIGVCLWLCDNVCVCVGGGDPKRPGGGDSQTQPNTGQASPSPAQPSPTTPSVSPGVRRGCFYLCLHACKPAHMTSHRNSFRGFGGFGG